MLIKPKFQSFRALRTLDLRILHSRKHFSLVSSGETGWSLEDNEVAINIVGLD